MTTTGLPLIDCHCTHCGADSLARGDLGGKIKNCPKCETPFRVPRLTESALRAIDHAEALADHAKALADAKVERAPALAEAASVESRRWDLAGRITGRLARTACGFVVVLVALAAVLIGGVALLATTASNLGTPIGELLLGDLIVIMCGVLAIFGGVKVVIWSAPFFSVSEL